MEIILDRSDECWATFMATVAIDGRWVVIESSKRITPDVVSLTEGWAGVATGGITLTTDDSDDFGTMIGKGAITKVTVA